MPIVEKPLRVYDPTATELGRRLGRWCWGALSALPRVTLVALVPAVVYHHFVPGIPLGGAFLMFLIANVATLPIPRLVRLVRRRCVSRK